MADIKIRTGLLQTSYINSYHNGVTPCPCHSQIAEVLQKLLFLSSIKKYFQITPVMVDIDKNQVQYFADQPHKLLLHQNRLTKYPLVLINLHCFLIRYWRIFHDNKYLLITNEGIGLTQRKRKRVKLHSQDLRSCYETTVTDDAKAFWDLTLLKAAIRMENFGEC